ncbi:MAG: hypothetical protein LBP19_03335 [Treponema sp.]|jgi:hypothetical protein|nr:hypothetical protein [Treponema sp.]
MKRAFFGFIGLLAINFYCHAQQEIYSVGDRGPAGGIIFFDKGIFSDGWRYLEVAPPETEFESQWGPGGVKVNVITNPDGSLKDFEFEAVGYFYIFGTGLTIGSGKRNTQLIIEQSRVQGENGHAAQTCINMKYNGFADWFMPSRDEMNIMYRNLVQSGLVSFNNKSYWSSSQSSGVGHAWSHSFKDGSYVEETPKQLTFWVRAIRAF